MTLGRWGYNIWRHYLSTDVGFVVAKAFYVEEKALWKLKVEWIDLGLCHEPRSMGVFQRIDIPADKLGEWVRTSGKQTKVSWGMFR